MPLRCASLRRARPLLGTLVEISARGDPERVAAGMNAAFAAIRHIQAAMSFHEPGSDVSRLNRAAPCTAVDVDPATWTVIARARQIADASGGDFDVTVAPRLVDAGFLPGPAQGRDAAPACGYLAVELLDGHRVRLLEPRWIDLGGIAKGYAADAAGAELRAHGIDDYVVNAGGDLAIGGEPEPVHVRDPGRPGCVLPLGLFRGGVATSAQYFARADGHGNDRHPIVDPGTGTAAEYAGSISVAAPDAMTADALTKVVAIRGRDSGAILRAFDATACIVPAPEPVCP